MKSECHRLACSSPPSGGRRLHELQPAGGDSLYYVGKARIELGDLLRGYHDLKRYLAEAPTGRKISDARRQIRNLDKAYRDTRECAEFTTQGKSEFESGNYEEALDLFNKAVDAGPLNPTAHFNRAHAYVKIGESDGREADFEAALEDFEAALILDPEDTGVLEWKALCLYYLKAYDEAVEMAEASIKELPDHWQAHNIRGLVFYARGKHKLAAEAYTMGLERDSDEVTLYINRALAYMAQEDPESAVEDLNTALEKDPNQTQIKQIDEILERLLEDD